MKSIIILVRRWQASNVEHCRAGRRYQKRFALASGFFQGFAVVSEFWMLSAICCKTVGTVFKLPGESRILKKRLNLECRFEARSNFFHSIPLSRIR